MGKVAPESRFNDRQFEVQCRAIEPQHFRGAAPATKPVIAIEPNLAYAAADTNGIAQNAGAHRLRASEAAGRRRAGAVNCGCNDVHARRAIRGYKLIAGR